MRNHNIIILLYICQCTSPDIHTQVQARNLPWSRLGHRFSWHKKIIRTSLLCVWHFKRMFLTNTITLDWSQCIHFFLFWSSWVLWLISCALHWHWGNLGMGRPWLAPRLGPALAHPTHQWHGQWAASYNEIRWPIQKLLGIQALLDSWSTE